MKKIFILLFAVVACFIASGSMMARVTVGNATSKVITLKGISTSGEITIQPNTKGGADFITGSIFSFDLFTYVNGAEKHIGSFTKQITNNKFEITARNLNGEQDVNSGNSRANTYYDSKKALVTKPATYAPETNGLTIVTPTLPIMSISLKDSSRLRIVALSYPFKGAALAPGQETKILYGVNPGQIEIVFKHAYDEATQATGRRYRQSVYSGIIVEGQKQIVITDQNLQAIGGSVFKTSVKSMLPNKFVFVAGDWNNEALSPGQYSSRREVNEGFNSMTIQYVGSNGLKYQADIEVILTKRDKPLVIKPTDLKNINEIKQ